LGTEQRIFGNIWAKDKGSNTDGKNCIMMKFMNTYYQRDHTKDVMDGACSMHVENYNVYIT
jgi:hypothetical protein